MTSTLSLWRGWIERPVRAAADIAGEAAGDHGLTLADLRAPTRRRAISRPRQAAMAALRAETRPDGTPRYSFAWIARFLGVKNHAAVIHGVRAHHARSAPKADRSAS